METKANEPAFSKPAFYHPDGAIDLPNNGLTKREYFAAMELQGLLANDSALIISKVIDAVKLADALVDELSKKKTND